MDAKTLLTSGLQAGFAGGTDSKSVDRGGFSLRASHVGPGTGEEVYHDEWVDGGGQELVRTEAGEAFTRVYVGGVISDDRLGALGITEKDVLSFLKQVINDHGQHTRFDEDFSLTEGDWRYVYAVTLRREDPYVVNGVEEIFYKDKSVFIHTFGISRVIE